MQQCCGPRGDAEAARGSIGDRHVLGDVRGVTRVRLTDQTDMCGYTWRGWWHVDRSQWRHCEVPIDEGEVGSETKITQMRGAGIDATRRPSDVASNISMRVMKAAGRCGVGTGESAAQPTEVGIAAG
jgi:hypothetical protein